MKLAARLAVLLPALVVLGFLGASPARAATAAIPSLDDITGNWMVSDSWLSYTFGVAAPHKGKSKDLVVINKVSGTEVEIIWYGTDGTWIYSGQYLNGVLAAGTGSGSEAPAAYTETLYMEFTGAPGKVKMRGKYLYYELTGGHLDVETFAGRPMPAM